jgi:hypothetical protein
VANVHCRRREHARVDRLFQNTTRQIHRHHEKDLELAI